MRFLPRKLYVSILALALLLFAGTLTYARAEVVALTIGIQTECPYGVMG